MEYATRHRDKNQGPHCYPLLIASERAGSGKQQGFPSAAHWKTRHKTDTWNEWVEDLDFQSGRGLFGIR